jgi:BON domain
VRGRLSAAGRAMLALGAIAAAVACGRAAADERGNYFNDPFVQVTRGIAACPVPEGPMITKAQMQAEAHSRIERGTSCYLAGRCRLPNSYLYDKEIIPRVKKAILASGRFAGTSVWAEGQRRWVWLKGCVRSRQQAKALERLVRDIDDVEAVIDELVVVGDGKAGSAPAGSMTR